MKFDCGDTKEVKWKKRRIELETWKPWFAWYPVRVGPRSCVWLEIIESRYDTYGFSFSTFWKVEYRKPLKKNKS